MAMQKGYIRTFSGKRVYPAGDHAANRTLEKIKLVDIAHHLSQINRYTGATKTPYTVGLHSLVCGRLAYARGYSDAVILAALVHDGSEAYLSDLAAPVKDLPEFAPYREIEDRLQRLVYEKFLGRQPTEAEAALISEIDRAVFCAEWPIYMGDPEPGIPAPSDDATAAVLSVAGEFDPVDVRLKFDHTVRRWFLYARGLAPGAEL